MTSLFRLPWLLFLVPMILAGSVYTFALQGPLFFDDLPNLTRNLQVQIDGKTFDEWRTAAFSSSSGPLRRPVAMLSFAVNYAIFGEFTPTSLKAVNLLIHLLVGALVYWLTLGIFHSPALKNSKYVESSLIAFAASAIWLLHPLHVSTVLYAVQRMAQLSTLFTLLGLCVFMYYRRRWAEWGASSGELFQAALWLAMITVLATLSKENGALLPWLLAVVEVTLFRGRWRGIQSTSVVWLGWSAFVLPLLLIVMIFLFSPETFTAGYRLRDYTLVERVMTQSRVLWQYLSWLCFPDISAMGFHHDDITLSRGLLQPITTLLTLLAWLALVVVAVFLRNRYPLLLFSTLFFLVAHVMESSVLALEMVFEHRNYLPSVGVCVLFASLLTSPAIWRGKVDVRLLLGGVLLVLFLLLIIRSQAWSDRTKLAQINALNHPSSPRAKYVLADSLMARYKKRQKEGLDISESDREENKALIVAARFYFLEMRELAPKSVTALVNLLYIDSYYFPELTKHRAWFSILEDVLTYRVIQTSDLYALSLLVDCVKNGGCKVSVSRVEELLNRSISRNPWIVELFMLKYRLLLTEDASMQSRLLALEHARVIAPHQAFVQFYRVSESAKQGDVAAVYKVLTEWLAQDVRRWDLPIIMPFFEVPDIPTAPEQDSEP